MKWNTNLKRGIVAVCLIVMASAVLAGSASAYYTQTQYVSASAPDSVTGGDTIEVTYEPYNGDNGAWRQYTAAIDVYIYADGEYKSSENLYLSSYYDDGSVYIDTSHYKYDDADEITIRSSGSAGVHVSNGVQTVSIEEEFCLF